jgi:phage-related protein
MGALGWDIKFFRLSSGRCPFDEFFNELQKEDQVRIRSRLEKVRQEGPRYDQFSSHLRDEIYELRFNISAGTTRLFFFYQPNQTIVITHGTPKKQRKIKAADIELAMQYRAEYLERGE